MVMGQIAEYTDRLIRIVTWFSHNVQEVSLNLQYNHRLPLLVRNWLHKTNEAREENTEMHGQQNGKKKLSFMFLIY